MPRKKSQSNQSESKPLNGYIEGYYGRLMDWSSRESLITEVAAQGMGHYLYAPKEDPFHRRDWRIAYPRVWMKRFAEGVAWSRRKKVELIPALAPGLSYAYSSGDDYRKLLRKFRVYLDNGCRTLALLMDDIPETLPAESKGKYSSLGQAHGHLLERLLDDLRKERPDISVWFCPTVYTDQFAKGSIDQSKYLLDLAGTIPVEIPIFWTGKKVVPATLTGDDIRPLADMFRNDIVIWDNFYANDYCPHKLFVGPYPRRHRDLGAWVKGVMLNPTGLPETDRLLLRTFASTWKGLAPDKAWRKALEEMGVPEEFSRIASFFAYPSPVLKSTEMQPARIKAWRKALHVLIWEWKSPLHREWYPFLYALDCDLSLLPQSGAQRDFEWLSRKYSPVQTLFLDSVVK